MSVRNKPCNSQYAKDNRETGTYFSCSGQTTLEQIETGLFVFDDILKFGFY